MKRLIPLLLIAIILPQVAFAAWWNPFSWKIFTRIFAPKTEVVQIATTTDSNAEIEKLRAEVEELKKSQEEQKSESKPSSSNSQPATKPAISKPASVSPTIQPQTNTAITYEAVMKKYTDFLSIIIAERNSFKKDSSSLVERQRFNLADDTFNKINSDLGYLESVKYWNPRPAGIDTTYLAKFTKLKSDYDAQLRSINADVQAEQQKNYHIDALIVLNSIIAEGDSLIGWLNDTNKQLKTTAMLISNKPYVGGLIGDCRTATIDYANAEIKVVDSISSSVLEELTKWKTARDYFNSNPSEFVSKNDFNLIPTFEFIKSDYSKVRQNINDIVNDVTKGLEC